MNIIKFFFYNTLVLGMIFISFQSVADESSNRHLLEAFHKYGITKCDNVILENSSLQENWSYFIEKHKNNIHEEINEVSLIQIYGSKNDTVKIDHSYIQTPEACYIHKRETVTFVGPCSKNIDLNNWYVKSAMPDKDYTEYHNKNGVIMFAKEITVGNFKACIKEYNMRNQYDIKQQKYIRD